jgi:hypothetical protein
MNKTEEFLKNWFLNKSKLGFKLILFFLFTKLSNAQIANYVNNGGFEICGYCASTPSVANAKHWGAIDTNKYMGIFLSKVYFPYSIPVSSFAYQWPKSGNNILLSTLFFKPNTNQTGRGYPRNTLKQILQSGHTYCVKVYYSITNQSSYGGDGLGAYFGNNTLDTITKCDKPIVYLTPQIQNPTNNLLIDTLSWSLLTGTFVANGTEKYMMLGNFKSDVTTNTVMINPTNLPGVFCEILYDDVSVIDIDLPAFAGPDIWGIPFNTVYLGRPQDVGIDEACMWYKLPNTTTAIDTAAGITVTVGITTNTYIVRQEICGNVKWDTVIVYPSALGLVSSSGVENSLKIYPNPANDILNIEFVTLSGVEACNTKYSIINSLGQVIKEEDLQPTQQANGSVAATINTKELANGVYSIQLSSRGTRDLNTDPSLRNDNTPSVTKRFVISR